MSSSTLEYSSNLAPYLDSLAPYAPLSQREMMDLYTRADASHLASDILSSPMLLTPSQLSMLEANSRNPTSPVEEVVLHNTRLAYIIASKYFPRGILGPEDIVATANIGLIRAAERFDPYRGARFSTYAALWIHKEIMDALTNQSRTIRLPENVVRDLGKIARARRSLAENGHPDPSIHQIATAARMSVTLVQSRLEADTSPVSLDAELFKGDGDTTIGDQYYDSNPFEAMTDMPDPTISEPVASLIGSANLSELQLTVLCMYYGLGGYMVLENTELIAECLGISPAKVRSNLGTAIKKLKAAGGQDQPNEESAHEEHLT